MLDISNLILFENNQKQLFRVGRIQNDDDDDDDDNDNDDDDDDDDDNDDDDDAKIKFCSAINHPIAILDSPRCLPWEGPKRRKSRCGSKYLFHEKHSFPATAARGIPSRIKSPALFRTLVSYHPTAV